MERITDAEMETFVETINKLLLIGNTIPCDDKIHFIECPICGGKRMMSRASINGHLHTSCETENCISFME